MDTMWNIFKAEFAYNRTRIGLVYAALFVAGLVTPLFGNKILFQTVINSNWIFIVAILVMYNGLEESKSGYLAAPLPVARIKKNVTRILFYISFILGGVVLLYGGVMISATTLTLEAIIHAAALLSSTMILFCAVVLVSADLKYIISKSARVLVNVFLFVSFVFVLILGTFTYMVDGPDLPELLMPLASISQALSTNIFSGLVAFTALGMFVIEIYLYEKRTAYFDR